MDARKSIGELHAEWEQCTRCELGERRNAVNGTFVAGEGVTRGIMFVGEGPGKTEEEEGRPFCGKSGELLREIISKLNIVNVSYITNVVTCRSCAPDVDDKGNQNYKTTREGKRLPKYKDQPPSAAHIKACLPRLQEEIYLVDPIVIVALGATAASALFQRNVTITTEAGKEEHIEIPGALNVFRQHNKKRGGVVERNVVRYLCVPTLHPAYVLRSVADHSETGATQRFYNHIKHAAATFERCAPLTNRDNAVSVFKGD